jgi:hypothetical protein
MPKASTFANEFVRLIFQSQAIPNLAINATSNPATLLTIALHTANPGIGGLQTTNEIAYTGYGRMTLARTSAGWNVSNGVASPVQVIQFGTMTSGVGGVVTHFSIGTVPSTTPNKIIYVGTVTPNINVIIGAAPRLITASSITEV